MEILIIALLTLLNGFFSLSEIALVSVKDSRIRSLADQGNSRARTILKLRADPESFLSSVQVGITLIGIISGAYGGAALTDDMAAVLAQVPAFAGAARTWAMAIVIGGITYFTIVVGELVPKTIALNHPERIALFAAPVIHVFSRITFPIVKLLSASTALILRVLPIKASDNDRVSEEELRAMIRTANVQGVLDEQESEAHQNLFRFSDQVAKTLMTPRNELEWIDSTKPLEQIIAQVRDSHHSKFPVCKGQIDEVQGTLSIRDLLDHFNEPGFKLSQVVRPPIYIPQSATAFNILNKFKRSKEYTGLVIDEHGQLKGMVTLHDLTEAIVGDLPDEDEDEAPEIVQRADGSYLVGGQVLIGELNRFLERDLLEENTDAYTTVAGYFLYQLERLPVPGDQVRGTGFTGEVLDMDGNRIDKVLITLMDTSEA